MIINHLITDSFDSPQLGLSMNNPVAAAAAGGAKGMEENRGRKWEDDDDDRRKTKDTSLNHEKEEHGELQFGKKRGHRKLCARGHWRPNEDSKLIELVSQHGPQNWNLIAEELQGRSGKSCRLRWFNQLDPRINRRVFSDEEEERLLAAHRIYGNKWATMARLLFPGRTDNAVKNHWHVIKARKLKEQSTVYSRSRKPFSFSSAATAAAAHQKNINNAISDQKSTISTQNVDESAASSDKPCFPIFLSRFSPAGQHLTFADNSHADKSAAAAAAAAEEEEEGEEKAMIMRVNNEGWLDQAGPSDSNSEVSVIESAATEGNNVYMYEENEGRSKENKMNFIDFLGVGAT